MKDISITPDNPAQNNDQYNDLAASILVSSPCISLCRMDDETGLCEGCARTLDEICDWADADDAEKRAILHAIDLRRGSHNPSQQ
ncbi:DUF1289 domain-containing protein [Glaciimonas sp. PCH181]|uniref:DUF1289 domain-containing protein n=1 Tax=Glaciimonas sp. PCH181 TaxID=2133943 RepID=UPI000D37B16D|nr:DUF1289 domain-containing protein [Glaciimonas sp. PCH181]PUA17984.1 DUF1289 domain-containing protein [Glaciimonas sp. PCH181]